MSKWLLHLKILSRDDGNLFLGFLITHLEYLKDFCFVLSLGLQGTDICFNGQGGFRGRSCGRGFGFGGADGLGTQVSSGWSASGVVTFVGTVALLPAAEAKSFLDASRSFHRSELREGNGINVHSVGVMSGSGEMDGRRKSSSLQHKNSHFLSVEHLGLFNPFCDGGGY